MSRQLPTVVAAAFLIAAAGCGGRDSALAQRQTAELKQALAAAPRALQKDRTSTLLWSAMRDLYASRNYQTIWIEDTTPGDQLDSLLAALEKVRAHGIDPERYGLADLTAAREASRTDSGWLREQGLAEPAVVPLDVKATWAWIRCAADLSAGAAGVDAATDKLWRLKRHQIDFTKALAAALDSGEIGRGLEDFAPTSAEYARLKDAYVRYLDIAKRGGWGTLPATLTVKKGARSPHLTAVAKRLAATQDLNESDLGEEYDESLAEAVARFERRHGLEPDGVIGRQVVAEMNVPVESRLRQLELNLERWRWLPPDLGDRYIFINVPEYRLEVHEAGRVALDMKVVVGARNTPTPIFSDTMTHVVFSPYWNVPDGIAAGETLPAVQSDPSFLARNQIEVVGTTGKVVDPSTIDWSSLSDEEGGLPYRFRQRPGSSNSLGLVKFVFPNEHDVYLHDTPADALFARAYRAMSHGCVRLEKPQALAEYVLSDQPAWTSARIVEAMQAGEEQHVKIARPIAVHLMYWTARVTEDGIVQFRQDVYGRDSRYTTAPWRSRPDPLVVVSRSPSRF